MTPFVIQKNGRLTGYSIELWQWIVREARLPFDPDKDYKIVENVAQMLDEIREGRADAGVAAVSITSEREKTVTLVIRSRNGLDFWDQGPAEQLVPQDVVKVSKGTSFGCSRASSLSC